MIRKTVHYSFREYDSRITSDVVKRAYFGNKIEHTSTMDAIKIQFPEMLGWITEHMVLPTIEASVVRDWAFEIHKNYPTRTTIPAAWEPNITDPKSIHRNARTGYTKHTSPCNIGVLGGMVRNLKNQREFTEPQVKALNILFETMVNDPVVDYCFPAHWIAYDFVYKDTKQVSDHGNLADIFGV